MFKQIESNFNEIAAFFLDDHKALALVNKAYNFAKRLHGTQTRKDGTPYIGHPVDVALILAKLNFDENVVSAAMLHDVVEDCDCDLQTIASEFGDDIAEMVDCVSAIDRAKYVFDKDNLYELEDFEKASIEEQSFKKLIAIGKKNPAGFCIKFADRLHNLRTIGCFDYSKQLEKVKETEKWILPIAKVQNSEYFYRAIANECFKIKYRLTAQNFLQQYSDYHISNKRNIENLEIRFKEAFAGTHIRDIKFKDVREYKVYDDVRKIFKSVSISKISQDQILHVANYNIYLLYKNKNHKEVINKTLNIINKNLATEVKVIDAKMGSFTKRPYYQLCDNFYNIYNLYIMSMSDYQLQRNGTLQGQDDDLWDSDSIEELDVELIKVVTKSGEEKYMPKDSTVLDFAFKIHKEIGLGFKYAIVNNSKTKSPPYTKLYDGDQVEIVVEKDKSGEIKNNAELRWLMYVNTDFAKKSLIKYFEKNK